MSISATNRFYVYVYLDPRKPGKYKYGEYEFDYEPFYVGKGEGYRINVHLYESKLENDENKLKTNKIKKIQREIESDPIKFLYKKNMIEQNALELETIMIVTIGRINLNAGPLTNLTNGGEGKSGHIVSDETKQKISNANKGQLVGEKNPMYGKTGKDAPMFSRTGDKHPMYGRIGDKHPMYGNHHTEKAKQKMSAMSKYENNSKNKYHFYCSDGKDYWNDFTKNERHNICGKFREKNTDIITYKGITITRKLK